MVKTDIEKLDGELNEVYNEFYADDSVDIFLSFCEKDGKFIYEITCNDEICVFSYPAEHENELIYKRYKKRYAKLALYEYLSKKTGKHLPWGALTGIRPTKLYYQQGDNRESFLKDVMQVSDKKYSVLSAIASAQSEVYVENDDNADFFVGIPLCPSRCQYCSFISAEITPKIPVNEYIAALCKEITEAKKLVKNLRSVYVGGGTPVSVGTDNLKKVLEAIGEVGCEYTVEAGRADCINDENLKLLKDYGVTRVCVNPQTFCDSTLELIGRKHDGSQVIEKFHLAKKYGFDVNMDLIAGLPLETFDVFAESLEKAISLKPENITVHTLCLKKGSKLKELCSRLPEGEVARMIDYSGDRLAAAGYSPYYLYRQKYMAGNLENTGYTLPGKACIYNIDVMEEISQNIACGANAVSKRLFGAEQRIERLGSPKDLATYIAKIDEIIEKKRILFTE